MRFLAIAPLAVLACLAASPARAADDAPVILEPSSQWNVDFAEDRCRLARTFGGEGNRHILLFEQGGPTAAFGLTVAGPQFERFKTDRVAIRFGEYPVIKDHSPFIGTNERFGPAVIWSTLVLEPINDQAANLTNFAHSLPEIDLEVAAKVATVSVRQGKREVIFKTGELTEAVMVLNQCTQDLLNSWGLDLERHRTATRMPVWTNGMEVAKSIQASYPTSALSKGEQAILWMRAIIDETGKVSECATINATIAESFNSFACKSMQHAHFEPALDRHGQPMRSFYITTISFVIN